MLRTDRRTDRPKPICPLSFFEVGGHSLDKTNMTTHRNTNIEIPEQKKRIYQKEQRKKIKNYLIPFSKQISLNSSEVKVLKFAFSAPTDIVKYGCLRVRSTKLNVTFDKRNIRAKSRQALVGYIKLFIICIFFIILDISLLSYILIVNVWPV